VTGAGSTRVYRFRQANSLILASSSAPDDQLGLRWEYFGPPHNFRPNIDSNFYFGVPVTPFTTASNNPYTPVNNPFYASLVTGASRCAITRSETMTPTTSACAPGRSDRADLPVVAGEAGNLQRVEAQKVPFPRRASTSSSICAIAVRPRSSRATNAHP